MYVVLSNINTAVHFIRKGYICAVSNVYASFTMPDKETLENSMQDVTTHERFKKAIQSFVNGFCCYNGGRKYLHYSIYIPDSIDGHRFYDNIAYHVTHNPATIDDVNYIIKNYLEGCVKA